jgi:NAD(P)-dependent dehydrogenase (short-subunit alcohol dehydrogenase family)
MRKPAAITAMMDAIGTWGGPDILVNNAGIQQTVSFAEVTQEIWDDILAVNLSGAFHTMRRALPEMAKRGYGRVQVTLCTVPLSDISISTGQTNQRSVMHNAERLPVVQRPPTIWPISSTSHAVSGRQSSRRLAGCPVRTS